MTTLGDLDAAVSLPSDLAVLMYHYVRPADPPVRVGSGAVDLDTFAAQLDDLQRHASVVSWPQVAAALTGGPALPPNAVLLTFDDGEDDHHRYVLPMLAERHLTGTFFVMARDPAEGLTVGHRIHVVLAYLSQAELRAAIVDRLSPADQARFVAAETEQARHPFSDPVDDLKWVLQRDLAAAASPILSRLVDELAGPEPEVAAALHLDARQMAELQAEGGWPFAYPFGGIPTDPGPLVAPFGFTAAFAATATDRRDRWRLGRVDAEILGPTPTCHPRFAPRGAVRGA